MSIVIQDPNGDDVSVNLKWSGGMINEHESALIVEDVGLIDPESIDTPKRVWL